MKIAFEVEFCVVDARLVTVVCKRNVGKIVHLNRLKSDLIRNGANIFVVAVAFVVFTINSPWV